MVTGPETKNDYAGEDQQQFTAMLCSLPWLEVSHSVQKPDSLKNSLLSRYLAMALLRSASLTALFWFSGAMSNVTCVYVAL
jgi:hypothetical protein